jgi:hypothetical protein
VLWSDLERAGAGPGDVDDLIDALRATGEADTAVLVKQQRDGLFKVSARSRGARDLSVLAAAFGGGGHRLAAGYTRRLAPLRRSSGCAPRSRAPRRPREPGGPARRGPDGVALIDKPAGITSHDAVAIVRRHSARARSGTPARWTRWRPGSW